jgi:hypothetical protein
MQQFVCKLEHFFLGSLNRIASKQYTNISSVYQIKQRQEHIGHVLTINNIKFEVIDVAASQPALQYMKRQNNGGSTRGRAKELPQVFVGGQYRGVSCKLQSNTIFNSVMINLQILVTLQQYQDLINAIDQEELSEFLQPAENEDDALLAI